MTTMKWQRALDASINGMAALNILAICSSRSSNKNGFLQSHQYIKETRISLTLLFKISIFHFISVSTSNFSSLQFLTLYYNFQFSLVKLFIFSSPPVFNFQDLLSNFPISNFPASYIRTSNFTRQTFHSSIFF